MMKLDFTRSALRDLKRLREFIAIKNPTAARRISQQLKQSINRLVDQPLLGHPMEELPDVRELVAGDYLARYIVLDDRILILRVWHTKEDR